MSIRRIKTLNARRISDALETSAVNKPDPCRLAGSSNATPAHPCLIYPKVHIYGIPFRKGPLDGTGLIHLSEDGQIVRFYLGAGGGRGNLLAQSAIRTTVDEDHQHREPRQHTCSSKKDCPDHGVSRSLS